MSRIKNCRKRKHQVEYLVGWEGCASDEDTWEPLSNLANCKELIDAYLAPTCAYEVTIAANRKRNADHLRVVLGAKTSFLASFSGNLDAGSPAGRAGTSTPKSSVVSAPGPGTVRTRQKRVRSREKPVFQVGDEVRAIWQYDQGGRVKLDGVVHVVNDDSYGVYYADGDFEACVLASNVFPQIESRFEHN